MNKKLLLLPVAVAGLLYFAPSGAERQHQLETKLEVLEQLEVFKHYYILKELMEYKESRAKHTKEYEKYKRLYEHEKSCITKARSENIATLKIEDSYNEKANNGRWHDINTYLLTFSFTGRNLLGAEQKIKKEYTCKIVENKEVLEEFKRF